jgi:hypothetical protein
MSLKSCMLLNENGLRNSKSGERERVYVCLMRSDFCYGPHSYHVTMTTVLWLSPYHAKTYHRGKPQTLICDNIDVQPSHHQVNSLHWPMRIPGYRSDCLSDPSGVTQVCLAGTDLRPWFVYMTVVYNQWSVYCATYNTCLCGCPIKIFCGFCFGGHSVFWTALK